MKVNMKVLKAQYPDVVKALTEDVPISSITGRGVVPWRLVEALEDHPFSEITRAVSQAVRAKLNPTGNADVYVMEYFLGKVIVQKDGKLFEIEYTLDDETGEATLGKAKEVRVRFVPAEGQTEPTGVKAVKEVLEKAAAPMTEEMRTQRRLAGLPG